MYLLTVKGYEIGNNNALNGFFDGNPYQNLHIVVEHKSESLKVHSAPIINKLFKYWIYHG